MWEGPGANKWADSQLCISYKLFQNNYLYRSKPPICVSVCVLCKKNFKLVYFFGHTAWHVGSSLLPRMEPLSPAVEVES